MPCGQGSPRPTTLRGDGEDQLLGWGGPRSTGCLHPQAGSADVLFLGKLMEVLFLKN